MLSCATVSTHRTEFVTQMHPEPGASITRAGMYETDVRDHHAFRALVSFKNMNANYFISYTIFFERLKLPTHLCRHN